MLDNYDYTLPDDLIAKTPRARGDSRLLTLDADGAMRDLHFNDLPSLLHQHDILVFNDTKVMKARLFGQKSTGGKTELLIERVLDPHTAAAHGKNLKIGACVMIERAKGRVLGRDGRLFIVRFDTPIGTLMDHSGQIPVPPYFERLADDTDTERYQSLLAADDKQASVAAPTASLHFSHDMLAYLRANCHIATITLHVGAGTFLPIQDSIERHVMHKEYMSIDSDTANAINKARARGGRVIAVGTTVLRALSSAWCHDTQKILPHQGDTDIFIHPPMSVAAADVLISNFHLPKSTLLLLVSAFNTPQNIKRAYAHAINARYRFFSYGDAMWVQNKGKQKDGYEI